MEMCDYEKVKCEDNDDVLNDAEFCWTSFRRQLLVCSVLWMSYLLYGICVGTPTVLIPQIRMEANSTEAITEEMASWLTAIYGYGAIPWVIILPTAAAYIGRKITYILIYINTFAAFIVFYFSTNVTQIFVSEAMDCIIGSSLTTIAVMVITEYTSPKYRGIFLTFKSATFFWGIWISNVMGTFFHWRYIGLIKVILSIYPLLVIFTWPESPYWLASKGRDDACAESHRWLKGKSKSSERELESLIKSQNESNSKPNDWKFILSKEFCKSILLCFCIFGLYSFSGKLACGFYSLDILKKITSSESTAYTGMLILDGISVLGMYIGSFISKFVRRRPLFFVATSVGLTALFFLGFYTYLIHIAVIKENKYISIAMLSMYSLGMSCGPMIMSSSLYGELLPLKFRSLGFSLVAVYDKILMGTVVKLAPFVMKTYGLHSAFFFFGITSTISLILLYKYLPETKDKTLLEIAEIIRGDVNNKTMVE